MKIFGHSRGSILVLAERLRDCNVSLRWGGDQAPGAINGSAHLMDGLEQLKAFTDAGIPTLRFTTSKSERDAWSESGLIVLGRNLNHTQGFDIAVPGTLKSNVRWQRKDFWTVYQPARREWRFHILKDNSIARGLKVWAGTTPQPVAHPIIRSRRLGWHLQHDVDPPKGIRSLAKKAVAACKYDLGAVDILEVGPEDFRILEVNSRPAVRDDYTIAAYEKAFRRLK